MEETAKSLSFERWSPTFVRPWRNVFGGDARPPDVVLAADQGPGRAPADRIVNGCAEYRRHGHTPLLAPGDVVHETVGESVLRVPLALAPRWELRRAPEQSRDDFFALLGRQAALAQVELSTPHPRMLLGAARAWRLGSLRCEWHAGFVVAARWSSAWTVRDSMAWHLWHLLASPAGVGLETFSGTPVDAGDLEQTLEVIRHFPAPRLREVCFETNERVELPRALAGVTLERRPLGWLEVEHSPLPEHVALAGPSNRLRFGWRQLVEVQLNGHSPRDCCVWHSGLWVELRGGDEVTWPGGRLRVREAGAAHHFGSGGSAR